MSTIGVRVTVHLDDGSEVKGWDLGTTPLGLYVALDREAKHIRFIPHGLSRGQGFHPDDRIEIEPIVKKFYDMERIFRRSHRESYSPELVAALQEALDKTDFNEVRRLHRAFVELRYRFAGDYERLEFKSQNDDSRKAMETIVETRMRYIDLVSEMQRSGMLEVLVQSSKQLQETPLPWFDFVYFSEYEDRLILETMMVNAQTNSEGLPRDGGHAIIEKVSTEEIIEAAKDTQVPRDETKSQWPKRLRIFSATGKMAVGSLLTTANVGAGVIAGVVTALPTLGIGAIAGAVGVATSAYTGLNAALDGVKDLAAAIEAKPISEHPPKLG